MSALNRRDFGMAMAAFAALASRAEAQAKGSVLSQQKVFHYDQLPVRVAASGAEGRAVMQGVLPTGEAVEVHETVLAPGQMPHPAHKHEHSELLLIREGTVQYQNDGKMEMVGPGDVCFSASNVMHGLKNTGTVPAKYFVVAVGVQKTEAYPPK